MFCQQCGAQLDDKALFCNNCGTRTNNAQQPVQQQPVQQPVYQQPVYQQPVYQQPVYQQPVQQPVYQQPYVQQQPVYQQPAQQQPKKKINGKLIAIIGGAVAVVAAIVVAIILIFGGDSGSGKGTGGSGGKSEPTEAGGTKNNFDLGSAGATNAMIGSLQNIATANGMDFEITVSLKEGRSSDDFSVRGSILFDGLDWDKLMLSSFVTLNDEEVGAYAYDGWLIAEEGGELRSIEIEELIGDELDEVTAKLEQYGFADLEFTGAAVVDFLKQEMDDEDLEILEEIVGFETLEEAFDGMIDNLNDDDWLQNNLDSYSRTTKKGVTQISLEITSFDFLYGVIDHFLPILDVEAAEAVFNETIDLDELREELANLLEDTLGDIEFVITLDVTIEDDFVTDVAFCFEYEDVELVAECHLSNIGNPSIDEDELAELLDQAEPETSYHDNAVAGGEYDVESTMPVARPATEAYPMPEVMPMPEEESPNN